VTTSLTVVQDSRAVLSKHARSFKWASRFLAPEQRDDAAVVYAFCRLVDDTADEAADDERAAIQLGLLRDELLGKSPARPLVSEFLAVADRRSMDLRYALELIEGVKSDLGEVIFETDAQLLRYCYRVAGTVGLMMCAVLGVDDPDALPHAIDLGVGMQITNISRDVLEDAERGRVYLPAERLRAAGVEPEDLLEGRADAAGVAQVVDDLLALAEVYYGSADRGLAAIPARSRFAILVAARLYRAIGLKIRRNGCRVLEGRTWVGWPGKTYIVSRAFVRFFAPSIMGFGHRPPHDQELHHALRGLPGVRA
jgi:phytoene synthase